MKIPETVRSGATVPRGLRVDRGVHPDSMSAVCANVVLIRPVLTTLRSDPLQLLLRRSVCVADLHDVVFLSDMDPIVDLDDSLANFASLKSE